VSSVIAVIFSAAVRRYQRSLSARLREIYIAFLHAIPLRLASDRLLNEFAEHSDREHENLPFVTRPCGHHIDQEKILAVLIGVV
jgi:hypothetical protein